MPADGAVSSAAVIRQPSWWREVVLITLFYGAYSWTRNQFGSDRIDGGAAQRAFDNATSIIRIERAVGLYFEERVQQVALSSRLTMQFWNTYYGTAHFIATFAVLVLLFVRRKRSYVQWRNMLGATTALAIVGYSLFPLMPPRLLDQPCPDRVGEVTTYGGACFASDLRGESGFGYVDTLSEFGGPWSFDDSTVKSVSNQYAAMPSLHVAWSAWCALALASVARRFLARVAILMYPVATFFGVIVTGNHFWLDGAGGLLGLAFAFGMIRWISRRQSMSQDDRAPSGHGASEASIRRSPSDLTASHEATNNVASSDFTVPPGKEIAPTTAELTPTAARIHPTA